jgi:alkylation response protein AidB-like acyl-CoA dehydrogenase
VVDAGTDEQRKRLLPGLATGIRLGSIALPSSGGGSGRPVARREAAALVLSGRDITATAAGRASDLAVIATIGGRPRAVRLCPDDPGLVPSAAVAAVGFRGTDSRALTSPTVAPADRMLGHPPTAPRRA